MDQITLKKTKTSIGTKIGITIAVLTVVTLGVVFGYAMYMGGFGK